MNFITDTWNFHFDQYKTTIPSNDEMLIRNLPGIKADQLWDELRQIDQEEERVLSTNVEQRITKLRNEHDIRINDGIILAVASQGLGVVVGGLNKLINKGNFSTPVKVALIAGTAICVPLTCWLKRPINATERGRQWAFVRINRIDQKIQATGTMLRRYQLEIETNHIKFKVEQLQLIGNGFKGIKERYLRIFKNSSPTMDKIGGAIKYLEEGDALDMQFAYKPERMSYTTAREIYRGGGEYQTEYTTTTYEAGPVQPGNCHRTPGSPEDYEVYKFLKDSGHNFKR